MIYIINRSFRSKNFTVIGFYGYFGSSGLLSNNKVAEEHVVNGVTFVKRPPVVHYKEF